jgi:DNA invertase Pin-like site-specific DNA recombinase
MNPPTYFLYARKSTDEDDRQILSIESQVTELREFVQKERLTIAQEFTESISAKVPGRPV